MEVNYPSILISSAILFDKNLDSDTWNRSATRSTGSLLETISLVWWILLMGKISVFLQGFLLLVIRWSELISPIWLSVFQTLFFPFWPHCVSEVDEPIFFSTCRVQWTQPTPTAMYQYFVKVSIPVLPYLNYLLLWLLKYLITSLWNHQQLKRQKYKGITRMKVFVLTKGPCLVGLILLSNTKSRCCWTWILTKRYFEKWGPGQLPY